ncbi:MAG: hypothetical protein Q9169_001104 [Polycauliona sp. 2 TL-2023]
MHHLATFLVLLPIVLALRRTEYPTRYPRCANDKDRMKAFFGDTKNVIVQPYCDNAINDICTYISSNKTNSTERRTYTAISSPSSNDSETVDGACQVYLLVAAKTAYETCVERFQQITIECMLTGIGRWADEGSQAGAMNAFVDTDGVFSQGGELKYWRWGNINTTAGPGYLAGPPGYFKTFANTLDVSTERSNL